MSNCLGIVKLYQRLPKCELSTTTVGIVVWIRIQIMGVPEDGISTVSA